MALNRGDGEGGKEDSPLPSDLLTWTIALLTTRSQLKILSSWQVYPTILITNIFYLRRMGPILPTTSVGPVYFSDERQSGR